MIELVVALIFAVKMIISLIMAFFGVLGVQHGKNYVGNVPDRVRVDPQLRDRANKEIVFGAVCAAVLCLPPVLWYFVRGSSADSFSLVGLALVVAYSFVVSSALLYPLERIKKMGNSDVDERWS